MPVRSYQGMQLLTVGDIARILEVTDALQLHRDWVVIPIDAAPEGREVQQPDGKIIIHAPVKERFEDWLKRLQERLMTLDLGAVPRPSVNDPKLPLTGPFEIKARGTRSYLGSIGILH